MWQTLKNLLYDFIVWTQILHRTIHLLFPIMQRFMMNPQKMYNYEAVDEAGQRLKLVCCEGKFYPIVGIDKIQSIPNTKIRKDDIILCSYPKAGCHWLQEIMNMIVTGQLKLTIMGKEFAGGIDLIPDIFLDSIPSPRVLNSHLRYSELPNGVKEHKIKIVLLVRNPKDTVVSFFNHHKSLKEMYGYDGELANYFKLFMDGKLEYGSYFDYMLEWDEVYKTQRYNPVLLVSYEELKKSSLETVKKIAKFLNVEITDKFAIDVLETCSFDNLKRKRSAQNEIGGKMYRKGKVGDWRNWLTDPQSKAIDSIWHEKMMNCTYQPQY